MILRCDIAFVLKSILCIINIVDCIVRGYIINIWYAWGNYRKTARNKTVVRYPSREMKKKTRKRRKEKKSKSQSSTMIFFHTWSVPNFFNRIIETSRFFRRLSRRNVRVEHRKEPGDIARRKKEKETICTSYLVIDTDRSRSSSHRMCACMCVYMWVGEAFLSLRDCERRLLISFFFFF